MPLTPSPEDHERLDFCQQQVVIQQWEQECDDPDLGPPLERIVLVGNDDDDYWGDGSGMPQHAIEIVDVDELRELIDSLQRLEPWLMQLSDGYESCDWTVTTVRMSGEFQTHGPFIKEAADHWAETQWNIDSEDTVVSVLITQLERPPIV